MNGPEHYREAEALIVGANALMAEMAADPRVDDLMEVTKAFQVPLALAQVHATLALAAATWRQTWTPGEPGTSEWLAAFEGDKR